MADRDYIDRTIETVRNHRDGDNVWPQWANLLADEVERLREESHREREAMRVQSLADRLRGCAAGSVGDPEWLSGSGLVTVRDVLNEAADEIERLRALCKLVTLTNLDTWRLGPEDIE